MKGRSLPQEGIVLKVVENLQEIIWSTISSTVKQFIKTFIENLFKKELSAKIGATRYERTKNHRAYRNDHYLRGLLTKFGPIEDIRVPRMERGGTEFSVFDCYERRQSDRAWHHRDAQQ